MIEDVESKVVGDQDVMNYSAQGPFWATTIKYLITNTYTQLQIHLLKICI